MMNTDALTELDANWTYNRGESAYRHRSGKWRMAMTVSGVHVHLYRKRGKDWIYLGTTDIPAALAYVASHD